MSDDVPNTGSCGPHHGPRHLLRRPLRRSRPRQGPSRPEYLNASQGFSIDRGTCRDKHSGIDHRVASPRPVRSPSRRPLSWLPVSVPPGPGLRPKQSSEPLSLWPRSGAPGVRTGATLWGSHSFSMESATACPASSCLQCSGEPPMPPSVETPGRCKPSTHRSQSTRTDHWLGPPTHFASQ